MGRNESRVSAISHQRKRFADAPLRFRIEVRLRLLNNQENLFIFRQIVKEKVEYPHHFLLTRGREVDFYITVIREIQPFFSIYVSIGAIHNLFRLIHENVESRADPFIFLSLCRIIFHVVRNALHPVGKHRFQAEDQLCISLCDIVDISQLRIF